MIDDVEIKVHNLGFVRLVGVMGGDESVVQAARVSSGRGSKGELADKKLIRYLMEHRHTSPFEMVEFKFHIKAPIFVERQWFRHRTASINSASGRYKEMPEEYWVPNPHEVRAQSTTNKQGSSDRVIEPTPEFDVAADMAIDQEHLHQAYQYYLGLGVAKELARVNLPLSLYTEWYWKVNLHNLFHFLKLRLDPHAQEEIREYAQAVASIVKEYVPECWVAFEEYVLYAVTLSRSEVNELLTQGEVSPKTWQKLVQSSKILV